MGNKMKKIFGFYILSEKELNERMDTVYDYMAGEISKIEEKSTWSAIRPVIHSLKELRNNTWDKNRVDGAIEWLTNNFKVKE